MKVTPDRDVPTIPKATRYHGDFLSPIKKLLLLAPLLVNVDIRSRRAKYPNKTSKITVGESSGMFFTK